MIELGHNVIHLCTVKAVFCTGTGYIYTHAGRSASCLNSPGLANLSPDSVAALLIWLDGNICHLATCYWRGCRL